MNEQITFSIERGCQIKLDYDFTIDHTEIMIRCPKLSGPKFFPYAAIEIAVDLIDFDKLGHWVRETYYGGEYKTEAYAACHLISEEFIDNSMVTANQED